MIGLVLLAFGFVLILGGYALLGLIVCLLAIALMVTGRGG